MKVILVVLGLFVLSACDNFKSGGSTFAPSVADSSSAQFLTLSTGDRIDLYTIDPLSKTAQLRDTLTGLYGATDVDASGKWIVAAELNGSVAPLKQSIKVDRANARLQLAHASRDIHTADVTYWAAKFHSMGTAVYFLTDSCHLEWARFDQTTGVLSGMPELVMDVSPTDSCSDMAFESDGHHLWVTTLNNGIYLVETYNGDAQPDLLSHEANPGIGFAIAGLANGRMVGSTQSASSSSVTCARDVSDVILCDHVNGGADPLNDGFAFSFIAHPTLPMFVQSQINSATPGLYFGVDQATDLSLNVVVPQGAHDMGLGSFNKAGTLLALGSSQTVTNAIQGNVEIY